MLNLSLNTAPFHMSSPWLWEPGKARCTLAVNVQLACAARMQRTALCRPRSVQAAIFITLQMDAAQVASICDATRRFVGNKLKLQILGTIRLAPSVVITIVYCRRPLTDFHPDACNHTLLSRCETSVDTRLVVGRQAGKVHSAQLHVTHAPDVHLLPDLCTTLASLEIKTQCSLDTSGCLRCSIESRCSWSDHWLASQSGPSLATVTPRS